MKKILVLLIALVMALSAVPVYAADSVSTEHPGPWLYSAANPPIEPLTSFASCPVPGCGGLVVLSCGNSQVSDTSSASFACTFSEHNLFGTCRLYRVIYKNSGYCNKCQAPLAYLTSNYGFTNTTHTHSYKHVFSTGNNNYSTVYMASCNI